MTNIIDIPEEALQKYEKDVVNIAMSDADAAKLLLEQSSNNKVKCNNIIYFKKDNIWLSYIEIIEDDLIKMLFNLNI